MGRAQSISYRLRWVILVIGVFCLSAGVWWIFGAPPSDEAGLGGTPAGLISIEFSAVLYLGIFLIMQWMFLRPRRGWQLKLTEAGRPMRSSIIAAGFMAMLLTTGLILTVLEIPNLWDFKWKYSFFFCWAAMAVVWVGWTGIFFIYSKQVERYTYLGKIIRGLIAGSFLELFVATGVYAWNPHNQDCYCARGSYTGLIFGSTVLLWAFGPGIIFLFMREKHRRQKLLDQ